MKKLFVLFVLAFGLMSVSGNEKSSADLNAEDFITCCTATITYNGNPVKKITKCTGINGELGEVAACGRALSAAKEWISEQ